MSGPSRHSIRLLAVVAFLLSALAGPVLAQSKPAKPVNPPVEQVQPAPQAPAAQPQAQGQPQPQPEIAAERFDDWFYRCAGPKGAATEHINCEVVQIAQTKNGEEVINVMTVSLSYVTQQNEKKAVMTILTPLNVLLPAGLGFGVDEGKTVTLAFRNCNHAGCWIQSLAPPELIESLKGGKSGLAKMQLLDGKAIDVKFSLKGLGNAIKALESGKPPKKAS